MGRQRCEFHDSNIISLNMCEDIIMRINVVGPLPDNPSVEDWQNSKWYQLVIVFEDIWEVGVIKRKRTVVDRLPFSCI